MLFLCDEMLHRLGRWLRAAGYDTRIAGGARPDRDLLAEARREGRLLITRDRKLTEHRGAAATVVLLSCNSVDACARELSRQLPVDWLYDPFSRCLECNQPIVTASAEQARLAPSSVRERGGDVYHCRRCGRLYWEGGHVQRMRHRLETWQAAAPSRHTHN
jgi:uncharacterized protein with PIN domain